MKEVRFYIWGIYLFVLIVNEVRIRSTSCSDDRDRHDDHDRI